MAQRLARSPCKPLGRPFPASFSLISTLKQLTVYMFVINVLPMTGFESRTSGIISDHSANWATTTVRGFYARNQKMQKWLKKWEQWKNFMHFAQNVRQLLKLRIWDFRFESGPFDLKIFKCCAASCDKLKMQK